MNSTDFRNFLTAGRAVFTVTRKADGARYTYRVTEADDSGPGSRERCYFVSVLTGSDNGGDYTYAGMLKFNTAVGHFMVHRTRGSKISELGPSWLGLVWLVSRIDRPEVLDRFVEIDHEGKCGRCGRTLTVPESIRTGLGPTCAAKG